MSLYFRVLDLSLPQGQSAFLWGPRKVGKSTFLKDRFPDSAYFDLLDSRLFLEFSREPWRFTEYVQALPEPKKHLPIIVDEVQKVPAIMDEIHRLIETHKSSFILCGSSARKMKRGKANLLGGRAWRFQMAPLTSQEIPEIDLLRALQRGLVPSHYETSHFRRAIGSYVTDYLREEVFAEGLIRNIGAFSRFFDALGFSHGNLLNFSSISRDCGVDPKTVREYFRILEDTLLGSFLEPYAKRRNRAILTNTPKFYLFDVGIAGHLMDATPSRAESSRFGTAFEHFILMELQAYRNYREADFPIRFWRTKSGLEVDFVLGRNAEVAIEVKGSRTVSRSNLKGMKAFTDEHHPDRSIVVSQDVAPRAAERIEILPWQIFLEKLWTDQIF